MPQNLIRLQKISKIYPMGGGAVHALDGVDLTIKKGEFVAIVGASGSGKSTLMHVIGLLDRPTEGEVFLQGKNIGTLNEDQLSQLRNKHIGFVFQSFNLLPKTSALDNVMLPLLYSGLEKSERRPRAIKTLEQVDLAERINHGPSELSGGQQQRVAVARALVNDPDIILADEPTGNLDTESGKEIMDLLTQINGKGNTVVLVTHELDIAKGAKRIIEMRDGKVVKDELNGK